MFKSLILNLFGRNPNTGNCAGPYCEYARPTGTFCEPAGSGVIARPGYAISNIPYILLGIYILIKDHKTKIGLGFGITAICVGTFSLIYDITFTYAAQFFDNLAMASFVLLLVTINLKRLFTIKPHLLKYIYLCLLLGYALAMYFITAGIGTILFASFVIIVLITEIILYKKEKQKYQYKYWVIGFLIFFIGWLIWQLDGRKIWCDSSTLFNGRAIFHYMTTATMYFLYRFHKSRKQI